MISLKKQLEEQVPDKNFEKSLLLTTWNIRDFGKIGGLNRGKRVPESPFYIAEILSSFDLIAVQEVNKLEPAERVFLDHAIGKLGLPNYFSKTLSNIAKK